MEVNQSNHKNQLESQFKQLGFNVMNSSERENSLEEVIKQHSPQLVRDGEVKLYELLTALNKPVDEKGNGYGLNFTGRNVAKAKYQQETDKVLKINTQFSRNFNHTQNFVFKGDNLDSLKILKSYYAGLIKCIYIDPPYNTGSDEFVYPDKFNKEEAEVLGLSHLSEADMDRLEFSFSSKKSHNGWLTFMHPRLKLARDLLSKDGVIFISIDDNEQANLKLLCDEIFGEENFVNEFIWINNLKGRQIQGVGSAGTHEYVLCYAKNIFEVNEFVADSNYLKELMPATYKGFDYDVLTDKKGEYVIKNELYNTNSAFNEATRPNLVFTIWYNPANKKVETTNVEEEFLQDGFIKIEPHSNADGIHKYHAWRWSREKIKNETDDLAFIVNNGICRIYTKVRNYSTTNSKDIITDISTSNGTNDMRKLGIEKLFSYPKPVDLIKLLIKISTSNSQLILDFFAGSGTTGHAVMQLNAEDGGNRKFILCQIDEPIKDETSCLFCEENGLPPVISSLTCERLKRSGDKILKEIEEQNAKTGFFEENKQLLPDIGYKVFDLTNAPKLSMSDNGIVELFDNPELTPIDRIYNLIFKVGVDNPAVAPVEIIKDCMYVGANNQDEIPNYYITNSAEIDKPENKDKFKTALQTGKVYIDGWTATLNTTLQETKDKEDRGKIWVVF